MPAIVRVARASDADAIAGLAAQLGYESAGAGLPERLPRILSRADHQLLIAELDGRAVGWLHATVAEYVEVDPFVVIGGLVVDDSHRGKGIDTMLMASAEEWARQRGCSVVRLWSSTARTAAHRFYERLGYRNVKTQYSFVRALDPAAEGVLKGFIPRIDSR